MIMKRLFAFLIIFIIAFSFFSCKVNKKQTEGSTDAVSDTSSVSEKSGSSANSGKSDNVTTVATTTKTVVFSSKSVDYGKAIKKLNSKQEKLVSDLGVTEKDKKIVAYYDDEQETQVIVCELKKNVVFKVYNYRFYKDEKIYKGFENLADVNDSHYEVYKDEKCIRYDESSKYRGKSFTEMLSKLNGYDIKY